MAFPRISFLLIFLFSSFILQAQLNDTFSDGDFSANPAWVGETSLFTVNAALELQSNGIPGTDHIYLSTANSRMDNAEWRIYTRFLNAPSNSNFIKIYLTASRPELDSAQQGYFLRIGETGSADGIDLYRQDSLTEVLLIDGPAATVTNGWDMLIKVNRDAAGNWEIAADFGNTGNFQQQGQILDNTYSSTSHFGFWIAHTSTRNDQFFFDDVYIGPPIVDTVAPVLSEVKVLSETELEVTFSEVVEKSSSENEGNYEVMPSIGNPASALRSATDSSKVLLTFASSFQRGTNYSLIVSGIADRNGNISNEDTATFVFNQPEAAAFEDVIINEIFPDPTPSVDLPETEFLEIYNRSTKLLDLEDWVITNGTTQGKLPSFLLQPGNYVILAPSISASEFDKYGDVISPNSWPALVNGGDNLGLRSKTALLIDSVDYSISWYQDESKKDGGYSLERINPASNNCPAITNWRASEDASGGTPGGRNSIFSTATDQTPPASISLQLIAPDSLLLCFNESMDPNLLNDPANYFLEEEGTPTRVFPLAPDFRCVKLYFNDPIPPGRLYNFDVQHVADCAGNLISGKLTAQLIIGRPAAAFEVVINELMPDPSPSVGLPNAEYVEIHNRTNEVLAIDKWGIQSGTSVSRWGNISLDAGEHVIVCSRGDSADFAAFGRVIAISLPSLTNSLDDVLLVNAAGAVMDYVYYTIAWYQDEVRAEGGYSLERINPNFLDCNSPGNWKASRDASGGTPGRQNSWYDPTASDKQLPQLTDLFVPDDQSIILVFDKQMDADQMAETAIYSISPGIGQPTLAFPNAPLYRSVELLLPMPLDSQAVYSLRIEGARDCAGNEASMQGRFGIPQSAEAGDILLNEILFNTYTGGKDFVEIYNPSDKIINLSELRIGRVFPGTDSIFSDVALALGNRFILPGQYLCLTEDPQLQRNTYMPPDSANFLAINGFPSYPDAEGECVIFRQDGLMLDRFAYKDEYHFPTLVDEDGVSLERIALNRPSQDPGNWHSASSSVGFASPGYPNSQAEDLSPQPGAVTLERQTLSPDGDGFEDVLPIHYDFDFAGGNARVSIMDAQGRLIRSLQQNTLLGTEPGTLFWDGRDDDNTRADVGVYAVVFEVSRQDTGERLVYKLACVVAKRLN